MSAKEQLINILEFMGEDDANRVLLYIVLLYIKESFLLKPKAWEMGTMT